MGYSARKAFAPSFNSGDANQTLRRTLLIASIAWPDEIFSKLILIFCSVYYLVDYFPI